jgi:hypothetical protein
MAPVIALAQTTQHDRLTDGLRTLIVCGCALALIVAKSHIHVHVCG